MQKIFLSIYQYFLSRKLLLYAVFLCSFALFAVMASRIRLIEDVYAIIPKDAKTEKFAEVFSNSKFADKLVVMVSLKDTTKTEPDSLTAYTEALGEKLQQNAGGYIKNIRYKIDEESATQLLHIVQAHLPVFLNEQDYKKIDTLIQPAKLRKTLSTDLLLLTAPTSFIKEVIENDPSGMSFIALKKLQQLQFDDNFELHNGYIVTRDKKTAMLFITPVFSAGETGKNKILFGKLDAAIDSLQQAEFSKIDTQYFGGAVVSEGNAAQLRKDTMLTLGITGLFLVLFITLYFRKKRAPVLILVPVVYGVVFAMAMVALIKGSISVIALGTGSIVLGVAVNYSLHVFNHFRHTGNMKKVVQDLAFPLTIGSITTIAGFFSLHYATSDMLKDLGLFAGFSLIGAALCTLIFLPHFIGTNRANAGMTDRSWIDKISVVRPERSKTLIVLIFGITGFLLFHVNDVQFEPDMTQLNYMSAKLKRAEQKINSISGAALKSVYLVTEATDLESALEKSEAVQQQVQVLQQQGRISNVSGVSNLYVSQHLQQQRIAYWNQYWTTGKKQKLLQDMAVQGAAVGFTPEAFEPFTQLLNRNYALLDTSALSVIRKNYLDDYITQRPGYTSLVTLIKIPGQQREAIVDTLEKRKDVTVLDRQYVTSRLTGMVSNDFNRIAWMVSIIVALVLLLTYGRIELFLISYIPMLISWIWILGIMALADIKFNIVNIIVSALIFGLGDDYSLFVMDGLLKEYRTGEKDLDSYKSSILLSAITTIAGLGVLAFAKHPALRSIAFISVTGILCVVLMSQVLIPFFFSLVIKNRIRKHFHPWTLWSWSRSVFSFCYFGFVSILCTLLGFFLIKLNILGRKNGKYLYHRALSWCCMSVLHIMFNFKKRIINEHGEDFSKPAVVIANHQSFLDILQMAMLNPHLILLTNKWVWNSPVFGWAIKMADFYPVANGIENSTGLLKTQTDKGYSIVVFPEGTRSSYPPMKRFHKGAFYLAEKLQLDVVPVLLHGLGYTMTKGDFLLKNGAITAKYLPRIKADDASWGGSYQERAKSISKYFKEEHNKLRAELETPRYFGEQLFFNYIYKGPVLEWYLRIKLRLENYYQPFHEWLPQEGKILDLGCGYGFMTYILHWASDGRRAITGVDYDSEKIAVAQNCYSRTEAVQFICSDANSFVFEQYNGIVISDVLHYLLPDQQEAVIEKAIHALLPGGVLVIRDGDSDLIAKHKGTKVTELFSTKIFSFNKTVNALHFLSGKLVERMAEKYGLQLQRVDNTKFTSNVVWVMRKIVNM